MKLPKEVQEFIGEKDYSYTKKIFRYDSKLKSVRKLAIDAVFEIINPYYEERGGNISNGMFNFLVEPLKNSNFYALKETLNKGIFELFLSSNKIVAGYFDGGEYFKRDDVKKCWESKRFHPEKQNISSRLVGFGVGTRLIYDFSDFIYVDNIKGKLYTGIDLTKNIHFKNNLSST